MVDIIADAKRHNSLLPIHRLVTEVFIEIFLYCIDIDESTISKHYASIRKIALVSTTWAALVFNIPALWGYIHYRQRPVDLLNSLMRSRGHPLVIENWRGSLDESVWDNEWLASFVGMVHLEIHQWERENLTISDARARASHLLTSYLNFNSARSFRALLLHRALNTAPNHWINPFKLLADRLRALSLWDPPNAWESPRITNLETLVLYGELSAESPSASQLAQVLRACPRLIRLEICYDSVMTEEAQTDALIELPALTVFDMEVSPAVASHILSVVRIPACEKFNLVVVSPKSTFLSDALQHHTSMLASRIACSGFVDFSIYEHDFIYKGGEVVSIRLIAPGSRSDSLTWIINHIHPPTPSVPTHLIIGARHFPLSALNMHPLASSVTKLEVYDTHNIVPYLGQTVTVEGVRRFPLPNLRELHLRSLTELEPEDLIQMVESRLGDIGSYSESEWARLQSGDWPELPVKLNRLLLPKVPRSAKDEAAKAKAAVRKLKKLVDTLWSSPEVEEHVLPICDCCDFEYSDYGDDKAYNDWDYWGSSSIYFDGAEGGIDYHGDERWAFLW
ncbi:hypothetical protein FRB96_009126 [Tulasnella sp. 330]|nr:hypothetical protein FRB96_009126 [Tulasnella sp. 330]KAG8878279.1 hypothetical protein FRB98_006294 [Tulasnella sp. 332]